MLACGLPVVANAAGDTADVLRESPAGVLLRDPIEEDLHRAAEEVVACAGRPDIRREARSIAERWFGLDEGVRAYDRIYREVSATHQHRGSGDAEDRLWPDTV
jgi:glycosyltransferase involved in cell wall biosynthesis